MFALPLLNGDSKIEVTSPLESAEYVDLTLEMLRHFQIRIDKVEDGFIVYGNQTYRSANVEIESDYSQLAFFAVAGLLSGPITCKKFLPGSLQPDRRIIDIVRKMGGLVSEKKGEFTFQKSKTVGTIIDVSQCPDIAPVLSMLGALSEGQTIIDNAQRLRLKETNRIKTTSDTVIALGAPVEVNESSFVIHGISVFNGGVFDSFGDHRIAMTIAVAAIRAKAPVVIKNAEAVNKSYPNFFKDYQSLGGDVTIIEE